MGAGLRAVRAAAILLARKWAQLNLGGGGGGQIERAAPSTDAR